MKQAKRLVSFMYVCKKFTIIFMFDSDVSLKSSNRVFIDNIDINLVNLLTKTTVSSLYLLQRRKLCVHLFQKSNIAHTVSCLWCGY